MDAQSMLSKLLIMPGTMPDSTDTSGRTDHDACPPTGKEPQ